MEELEIVIRRAEQEPLINDRPIIGRLGIGMLGIAQMSGAFTIVSKPKEGVQYRARVRLYDLLKEKLDTDDESIVKEVEVSEPAEDDTEPETEDANKTIREVDIGEYTFEDYDPKSYKYGTLIIADDVHPTFVDTFQKSLKFEKFKQPPMDWAKALRIASSVHSLQELGDYWKFLWELSASCPIPYVNDRALPSKLIADEQRRLESYDFKVIVDNIQLFKPVKLRGNLGGYTTKKIESQTQKIYGKKTRVSRLCCCTRWVKHSTR